MLKEVGPESRQNCRRGTNCLVLPYQVIWGGMWRVPSARTFLSGRYLWCRVLSSVCCVVG